MHACLRLSPHLRSTLYIKSSDFADFDCQNKKRKCANLAKEKDKRRAKEKRCEVQAPAFNHFFRDQQNHITTVTPQKYPMDPKTADNYGSISRPVFYLFCFQRDLNPWITKGYSHVYTIQRPRIIIIIISVKNKHVDSI